MEKIVYRGISIKITQDNSCESPRNWCNAGTMVCNNRKYVFGDIQYENNNANNWKEWFACYVQETFDTGLNLPHLDKHDYFDEKEVELKRVWEWIQKNMIVFKLWIYEHSGITIKHSSVDSSNHGWDNSNIGFHFITKEKAIEEWGNKRFTNSVREKAIDCLSAELEDYDSYLSGECYQYYIDNIDSCGGYLGYDHEKSGLLSDARAEIDYFIKSKNEENFARIKRNIKGKVPLIYRKTLEIL